MHIKNAQLTKPTQTEVHAEALKAEWKKMGIYNFIAACGLLL